MNTISLNTAVILAIQGFLSAGTSFSAHDITKSIRSCLEKDTYELSDRDCEDIDGTFTQRVEHSEVKAIIRELNDSGVLSGFSITSKFTGQYFVFSCPSKAFTVKVTGVTGPASSPTQSSNQKVDPFISSLKNYVQNHGPVTLKQIQSRFKRVPMTCQDFEKIIQNQSDLAIRPNQNRSQSLVEVV